MDQARYQEKRDKIKKGVKTRFFVSLILACLSLVLFICFNFIPVLSIKTLPGTKYQDGFSYPGFQLIFYGYGEWIIQGYTEYTFNIYNFIGFIVPTIGLIVSIVASLKRKNKKGTNTSKAVFEFVTAALVVFGSIRLFNFDKFAISNASKVTGSYQNYYTEYLLPARNGEVYFHKTVYPLILRIFGLLTVAVKILNGSLLVFQKSFAKKYKGGK